MSPTNVLIGIDLVQVSSVRASIERFGERFIRRLFTDSEAAYCEEQPHAAAERFAARFAAKEAAFKVLRPADQGVAWRSIEVVRAPAGWTELCLHADARALARAAGLQCFSLSISHEGDFATAVVIGTRSRVGSRVNPRRSAAARRQLVQRPGSQAAMTEQIRTILREHGRLAVPIESLSDEGDLYKAGMTSQASVNVMLALEGAFDIEFPDHMLKRSVFASVAAIREAIEQLTGAPA